MTWKVSKSRKTSTQQHLGYGLIIAEKSVADIDHSKEKKHKYVCTPCNLIVSFLLTAGHDTDGCRINTMF